MHRSSIRVSKNKKKKKKYRNILNARKTSRKKRVQRGRCWLASWPGWGASMRRKFSGTQTVVDGSRVFVKSFLSTHDTIHLQLVVSCPQWNKSIQFTSLKHDAFVTNQWIIESIPKTVREELPGWCNAEFWAWSISILQKTCSRPCFNFNPTWVVSSLKTEGEWLHSFCNMIGWHTGGG